MTNIHLAQIQFLNILQVSWKKKLAKQPQKWIHTTNKTTEMHLHYKMLKN